MEYLNGICIVLSSLNFVSKPAQNQICVALLLISSAVRGYFPVT